MADGEVQRRRRDGLKRMEMEGVGIRGKLKNGPRARMRERFALWFRLKKKKKRKSLTISDFLGDGRERGVKWGNDRKWDCHERLEESGRIFCEKTCCRGRIRS